MASVKVYPRLDKVNADGKSPIYLRVTKHRKSKCIALDAYIFPKDWNNETGKVKSTVVNAAQINTYISSKVAEAERIALELETRSTSVTAYDIKHKILGRAPGDFFAYFQKRKDLTDTQYSIGTIRRYQCVVNKLRLFYKSDILYFDDINATLIRDFQQHLLCDCKNHINTVNANLKVVRRLLNDAVTEGLLPFEKNPFNKIRLKGEPTKQTFLLDDELEKLENLDLPKDSQLNHHRNLYIFSAYACGIRIADLLMMRWRNVSDDRLYFQIRKNKDSLGVRMPPKALVILNFYKEMAEKRNCQTALNPDAFIFPLLRIQPTETDRKKIHNALSSATCYTNKDLKKLAIRAGLNKPISFHSARHSWAVRALQKGMRIEYVSRLMGHASVKNTEMYAKVLDSELDKAMGVFN